MFQAFPLWHPADRSFTAGETGVVSWLRQAIAKHRLGQLDEAAHSYRQVLVASPGHHAAKHLLGLLEHQRGNQIEAHELIRQAVAAQPSNADYLCDLGLMLNALGRPAEAIDSLRAALAVRPADPRALKMLGGLLVQQGRHGEAVEYYRAALKGEPRNAGIYNDLGSVLAALGETTAAIATLREALALDPDHPDVHSNLGYALSEAGAVEAAIGHCWEALRLAPTGVAPRFNLGLALYKIGDYAGAARAFEAVLERHPTMLEAMRELGDAFIKLGRVDAAIESYRSATRQDPNDARVLGSLLFCENYRADGEPKQLVEEARRYGQLVTDPANVKIHRTNNDDPNRRLRVGLVSADFRMHAVARFLDGPLAEIDPRQIELFAYANGTRTDAMTERLQRSIPNWRQVSALTDGQLAEEITNDGIDILVDLSGHSAGHRLGVFARKPAPIAVTWLGYFATTGLPTIDYVLANRWVIPEAEAAHWVETPWYLPDTYLCFSSPMVDVDVGPLPAASNGFITFGSANNLSKLSEVTVQAWSDVLAAVPGSRLILRTAALSDPETADRVRRRFTALGIAPDRLLMQPAVADYGEHLARYRDVDIALDSYPYAGGTTTVEALWMGVPVLTLKGDRYSARMGENIMHNLGMPEWIADSPDDYARRAASFAGDINALAILRRGLRSKLAASPMMDAPAFARNLEAAFRGMWQEWCARAP